MPELPRPWAYAVAIVLSACASTPQMRDADLAELLQRLPGHYDNRQQAGHATLDLYVARVVAPLIGDNVFYMRLTASNDPRRVLSQRIWSFFQPQDGGVAQSVFMFQEPERWRNGESNTQLFQSLMAPDLRALNGCELSWRKNGTVFEGTTGVDCRAAGASAAGLLIEQHIVLASGGLALAERQFGTDGLLAPSSEADPFERFQRSNESAGRTP